MTLPDQPFTISQINDLGLTRKRLRALVETGHVRRPLRGVYVAARLPDTPALRAACAAMVLPAHSVVCDRTAAWILGIDVHDADSLDVDPPVDVVAIGGADRSRRPELLGGKRSLQPDEIIEINGVRLTAPARTACDIACLRGRHRALAALDAFRRAYDLNEADLARQVDRFRGRRGVRQLRALVPLADPRAESPGESWTRLEIIDAGLPVPALQVWVDLPGWGRARLDHAYEHLKIAVEFDGREFHGEDRRGHDEARRAALRREGWIIIVVTKADFTAHRVLAWTAELRSALQDRTSPRKRRYPRGPSYVR